MAGFRGKASTGGMKGGGGKEDGSKTDRDSKGLLQEPSPPWEETGVKPLEEACPRSGCSYL